MAQRIEALPVTVPAGTGSTTPITVALPFDEGEILNIEAIIPDGCAGLVGFAFRQSSQRVIPFSTNAWIIGNNEKISWDTEGYPTGAKWDVIAYNTDIFPHTLQIRFLMNELSAPATTSPTLVPIV